MRMVCSFMLCIRNTQKVEYPLRMVFGWEKLPDEPLTTNYDIGGLEAWALHNGVSHSWKIVVVEVEVPKKEAG